MMKMISSTNARSSSGVMLISLSVTRRAALGKPAHSDVLQVFGFHLGNQVLRKVVQLDRQDAQVMNQPVVAEHGRDGDQQAGDRGDSAAATPGAMAVRVALPCWAMWPKVLITPQTVPSRPRNGAPLTAMASRIRPDSSFSDSWATVFSSERFTCSMPLSETNFLRPALGVLQPGVQFHAAGLVDHEQRAAVRLHAAVEDIQHVFLGAVFGGEKVVELLGAAHLQGLGDHDRPGDDREDGPGKTMMTLASGVAWSQT